MSVGGTNTRAPIATARGVRPEIADYDMDATRDRDRGPWPVTHNRAQDPRPTEAMIVARRAFVRRLWKTWTRPSLAR